MSLQDKQASKIIKKAVRKIDGPYQDKKLRNYSATMNKYLSKGHFVKILPCEMSVEGKVVWYLCNIQLPTPENLTRFAWFLIVPPKIWVPH
ncbi:hypothetical protein P5673_030222 [Acropora cervicornis]|uniref:Uncharacterized protein n=1 Tax=Acropora cervicornis TaxID=6130 RepID=A0AAD9UTJ3_ACRCE|nr:hypothetical protein P5673_030222 [Acropora cervicornis]